MKKGRQNRFSRSCVGAVKGVDLRSRSARWGSWVKELLAVTGTVGLLLGLLGAGGAGARGEAVRIQIPATMVAADETPTPKGDVAAAQGSFIGTLTKSDTGAVLTWQLSFGSLTGDAVAAHIHIGARGVAGPVVVPLCSPCTTGASGTANVN